MASENIEGTVTDSSGNPLQDAVIALFLTNKNASDGEIKNVQYTRTDSNGNYVIKDHPDADSTSQEWHVAGFYQDGTGEFNALSKPSVEASVGSAILDSLVQQFDPRAESAGTLSTATDQQGLADLTGSVEVISSGINGNQSFRFDGSSSAELSHNTTISTNDPFAVVYVGQQQEPLDSNNFHVDGGSEFEFALHDNRGTQGDRLWRGGTTTDIGEFIDLNPHIYTLEGINSSDIKLRIDGVDQTTVTNSSANLTGFKSGGAAGRSDFNSQIDKGQIEILNNHSQSELESVESRLASNYGITI